MATPSFRPADAPYVAFKRAVSRRRFLAGTGVLLALPMLESMTPAFAAAPAPAAKPRRMLGICNNLGLVPDYFFPTGKGRDYKPSAYLELLQAHREDFSVFSGVSHPDVDGGHPADNCFLTAAPHPSSGGFRNTISLDQFMAERIGHLTRFSSMTLGVNCARGSRSLSWTAGGVMIPTEERASEVFRKMFMGGSETEVKAQERRLQLARASSVPSAARRANSAAAWARPTANDSTNTSPASASSNSACRCPASGSASPVRSPRPPLRVIRVPPRSTWTRSA